MRSKIKTIPSDKVREMKRMSPYQIDELFMIGYRLLNVKGEENDEETETLHQKRKGQV